MKRRQGFTLVELMVSMALIIFMMAILSQAFMAALGTFRNLKGQGDMAEKLRAVTQILQRDLAADHFDGKRRLSDTDFWVNGPPSQGFFQIWQSGASLPPPLPAIIPPIPASYTEGYDDIFPAPGIPSYLTTNHALSFTVKLRGNDMGSFFTATPVGSGDIWLPPAPLPPTTPVVQELPNGIGSIPTFGPPENRYQLPQLSNGRTTFPYNYQWAAVAWFLVPQPLPPAVQDTTTTDPTTLTPGVPLYTLYRRQALLVPDNNLVSLSTIPLGGIPSPRLTNNFLEMSCSLPLPTSTMIYFNNPIDITVPTRRQWGGQLPYTPITTVPPGGALTGSDIQLNDVVSFDVRMLVPNVTDATNVNEPFVTLWQAPFNVPNTAGGINNGNSIYFPANPVGPMVFDTWSSVNDGLSNYSQWNVAGSLNTINANTSIPLWSGAGGPSIQAIQISIRIWDYKTNQTRQVTIVQAM